MKKFTQLFITILAFITLGAWTVSAWGDPTYCTYGFTKNEEKTSINNGETIYRATINGTYYGLSKLTFQIKMTKSVSLLHNESADLNYDIYLYNRSTGSWSKRESKTLEGYGIGDESETITYTTDLTNISAFKVVSTTNFGSYKSLGSTKYTYRSVSVSNVAFVKVSSVSANPTSLIFGDVTYGQHSAAQTVTATYMINYEGDMTASCTGDFSATVVSPSCACVDAPQTKTINVTFTPTQAGTRNGTLTIKNPDGTQTTVSLTGTGVRANPTLNMSNNGSVNVTTDKANPVELDLSTLKASGTTTGIGAFDSFVLQSADASTGAKAEGVTISGSKFSSTVGGTYTVRATTKQNNQYNSTYKDFTVTVNRLTQTISWTPTNLETEPFVEEDEVTATSIGDVTLEKSGTGADYVSLDGNTATIGEVGAASTVTLTATAAQTDVYAEATDSKTINLTSLAKQHITFDENLTKLKTTDGTKKKQLIATSDSGRDSYITFTVSSNSAGVTVTQEEGKWYLNYTGTAAKGIMVTAHLDGVAGTYVAASDVSQMVKVTDPTAVCDVTETLSSAYGLKSTSKTYDLTIPKKVVFKVRCSEKNLLLVQGYEIKFYKGNTQVGETYSYGVDDGHYYNQDEKTRTFDDLDKDITKVVVTSNASKGYDITEASYERYSYANPSVSALNYEAYALSTVADQTFTLSYANYQIELSIEGSSNFVLKSEDSFGDCETYGTKTVKVGYNVPAMKCEETAYLRIKDNTGALLKTVTLHANVLGGLTQNITSTNIKTSYLTTDSAHLNATTDRGLKNFTYSALPAGVASFDGNVMTFSQSGTIAVTVTEVGNATFNEATATVENIVVSKVTPDIAENPAGTAIPYLGTLNDSKLSGGAADITLRGVAHSDVAGSFAWTDPTHVVMDAEGTHNYSVTFTPTDGGMYTTKEFTIPITITRATQALAMSNGTVKVTVDGIDAGANDSYLDLNTLASHTSDIVNDVQRAGAVTYEVISENKANATISGSTFSAKVCDTYTIRATKAKTDYYEEVTADFTVTVEKRANTMTIAATEYEQFVDDVVSNVRDLQNSDAPVQTSSDFPTIAYYDVAQNKIFIPNSESDYQMFGSQKTVTIKIWQEETLSFEALDTLTITLTVRKYETTKSGEDITLKVNEIVTGNYSFTNTSADYPSDDLNADFYYTIDAPSFDNEDLNEGDLLITYDPAEGQITGHNAGTTKITFFQKETYKYTGATLMCNVTVEKRDNQIKNSWGDDVWQKAMSESGTSTISFSSTHEDYANYPISIERIYGEDVATLTGNAAGATITTNTTKGYAIWHVSQAENYEYYSAEADVIVTVGVPAPPTCYVYQDNSEHEFATGIGDAEGHFESPIAINSPVDKIWFNAKRQFGGVNKFVVQYSKDNGKSWSTLLSPSLDRDYKSSDFSATFPTLQGSERITNVRFGAATGATLSKWYKNVQISRRAYLNLLDAEKNKISKLPTMMCTIDETSSATEKFYIDYSTCADEISIESSNPEHFTVSRTSINVTEKHDNLTSAKEEITVTYHSEELGTHNGVITVRTTYQTRVLSVSGETTKRIPELIWQEGYTNNPLTLPVGLTVNAINPAAICTSGASVKYESSDESVVQITEGGYAFKVLKAGSAILTAKAPENDKWKEVSDTRVIIATDKIVQEIVWNQSFPRFMEPDKDVIDLDAKVYLRNLTTNELKYSAERTPYITYSCPTGNGVVSISGNKMTVLGYGEVKVTASVGGNADYAAAASVIMLINVRQPSVGCETPLVLNYTDIIDMFEVNVDFSSYTNLTTQEMISDEIAIDHSYGKPDKLSFSYQGGEYSFGLLKFFGGYVKFEQYVNGNWIEVKDSRVETAKNELKTNSDLQLDENADALRIIREQGGTGHHYIRDIQVTRKQYLHETNGEINLGEIKIGQATPVAIGFDYSDVKGDLTARTINNTTDLAIKDNGIIDLECGSFGHYDLQVTFTPTKSGDWQGTVEVYDPLTGLSITVGLTATVTASEEYIFNVEGDWNESENWTTALVPDSTVNITVAKDMIVNTAANVKSITINEGVTVTVKSGVTLKIGNGTPKNQSNGNLHVEDGGQVIVQDGGTLNINDFIIDAKLGDNTDNPSSSGQVKGNNINISGDAYFKISFDPRGAIDYGWYDFTVPFEVDVLNGVFDKDGNKLTNNVDYAVMEFSEAKRAENAKAWTWFRGTLQPGKLYSITLEETKTWNTFIFKRKSKNSNFGSTTFATSYTDNGETTDRGWNGLGNGTLQYCQLNKLPENTKIQVYDHANDRYVEREAAEYTYSVGTAFFVQVDEETEQIDLTSVKETRGFLAPSRNGRSYDEFRLSMMDEEATMVADQLWVSASEDATGEYVIGHDLVKMGTPTSAKVAQIWTENNGLKLCDIEMPLVNNTAKCGLGLYAPQAGSYWLAIDKAPEDATLYLTHNDKVIWDLTISPYLFDLDKGTTEGYGLRMAVKKNPAIMTGFDEAETEGQTMRKVLIDDKVYIITPEGKMYDIIGKGIKF